MFGPKLCKIYHEMHYTETFKNKSIGAFNKWVK